MISESQFTILYSLFQNNEMSQREFAKLANVSLGKINEDILSLREMKLITEEMRITENGIKALEPYKVDNAIIMAAGMSSRFAPISFEKPKGLLKVKGEILIERQIKQLQEKGITDITIVVGYKKEMFFYLEDKFNVKIVINTDYYKYNNPSTLMLVKEKLGNTYICSSDDYFTENVFEVYVYKAYYAAVYAPGETEEYCLTTDKKGRITNVTIGGNSSWFMLGHVYYSKEFSEKFIPILVNEYKKPESRELLWERLYMMHIKELDLYIKKYDEEIIKEFDSLDELREFDELYVNNADSAILDNICQVLQCEQKDIENIVPIKKGLTNTSFSFVCRCNKYVYRHPGNGTDEYINRRSEAFSMEKAKELGLDKTYIYMNPEEGWKISAFIEDSRELDYGNENDVKAAIGLIRKLHDANISSEYDFDIWNGALKFIERIKKQGGSSFEDFDELFNLAGRVKKCTENDGIKKCLCHCDCYAPNFLFDKEDKIYLIDWEYSGNDDPGADLGTFICCNNFTYEETLNVINMYLGHEASKEELRHYLGYVAITSYYWYLWAIYQDNIGNAVGEYLYMWYKSSKTYAGKALELYA